MNFKLETPKFIFRKLKISDYKNFQELFYSCFKKKVSYNFFKWRYFSDKFSFCYGVFVSSKLIANVGMKMVYLNDKKKKKIFSRHSSMVLNQYRGQGIFSKLLEITKKKYLKNMDLVVMWPNKNNLASFGIEKKRILKKKYYLYKTAQYKNFLIKTYDFNINKLAKIKIFIQNNESFYLKDYKYFKQRYLLYKSDDYLINKYEIKKLKSFFILKKNKDSNGLNYVVLDHFGSQKIFNKHLDQLINEKKNVIFWSKKKINKLNYKLINQISVNLGLLKFSDIQKSKLSMFNKKFMIGDTDSFISLK